MLISTPQGQVLPARNVLDLQAADRARRRFSARTSSASRRVNAELDADAPLGDAVKAVQARLPEVDVPQGFSVGFGAEVEQQAQAFDQLQVLLILGVLLVYAVMASQYESLARPLHRHVLGAGGGHRRRRWP